MKINLLLFAVIFIFIAGQTPSLFAQGSFGAVADTPEVRGSNNSTPGQGGGKPGHGGGKPGHGKPGHGKPGHGGGKPGHGHGDRPGHWNNNYDYSWGYWGPTSLSDPDDTSSRRDIRRSQSCWPNGCGAGNFGPGLFEPFEDPRGQ